MALPRGLAFDSAPPNLRVNRAVARFTCGSGGAEIGCLLLEGRESHRSFVRNFRAAAFTLRLVVLGPATVCYEIRVLQERV